MSARFEVQCSVILIEDIGMGEADCQLMHRSCFNNWKGIYMSGKIYLTACSDARKVSDREEIEQLKELLVGYGLNVAESVYLYDDYAAGREKAFELNSFFAEKAGEDKVTAIFDVSGGNVANELLPYLDYDLIADSQTVFWGYSDLTTIINAIYAKTGKASVLYQARHLTSNELRQKECMALLERGTFANVCESVAFGDDGGMNKGELDKGSWHKESLDKENRNAGIDHEFLRGNELSGTLLGGNLRCFLKLAGTEYMPELTDKVLLMEALGGDIYSARTMLAQLDQLGVFNKVRGILVGTFTALMKEGQYESFLDLLLSRIPKDMPVAVTKDVGHGRDAKAIVIGADIKLK